MQVTLKKIAYHATLSEETNCFTADVYVDGKKAFLASNRGHGGSTDVNPITPGEEGRALLAKVDAWLIANKPQVVLQKAEGNTPAMTCPHNLEWEVDTQVDAFVHTTTTKAALRRKVLFTHKEKPGIFEQPIAKLEAARKTPWVDKILNDLPIEDAVALLNADAGIS
jgi:hypothetical protein